MAGTLISPRHVIFCKHAQYYPPAGTDMRFVTKDNQTITRSMTNIAEVPDGDFAIGLLDADVPPEITFARILPDNWKEKFAIENAAFASDVFIVFINQDESAFVRRWQLVRADNQIMDSIVSYPAYPTRIPTSFSRGVRNLDSGSPALLFVDKKPIILTVATTTTTGDSIWATRASINAVMTTLGGGYTLTPMNLDEYTNVPSDILGVGVAQPQSGLDYPFVSPSSDIQNLIADFQLSVDNPVFGAPFKPPFTVKYLYGVGSADNTPAEFFTPTHAADVLVQDSNAVTVFNSTQTNTNFSRVLWGDAHVVYSWHNTAGECHLVAHSACGAIGGPGQTYDKYLVPQNAQLDARAVYIVPKRIKSIRVDNPRSGPSTRFTGKINFANGYSTELTAGDPLTSENFLVDTRLTINAVEGAGLGKYSKCGCNDDEPAANINAPVPITKINGIATTHGDFLLSAADCLYARRPTVKTGGNLYPATNFAVAGHQAMGANCEPCCKCPDYVDLALKINQYQSQYAYIGQRVNNIKDIHEQNIQKWIDERDCSLQKTLRLLLVAQRCPYMDVVMMICNPCDECLYSKSLELSLAPAAPGATAEVVSGYTAMFATGVNGRPVPVTRAVNSSGHTILSVPFSVVRSSDSAYVRFRVKFSVKSEYAVLGTLTGTLLDNTAILAGCENEENSVPRQPAVAIATQALYCDASGNTNLP
jgi:hypothetical protein